jgi:hypothetical protein
MRNRAEQILRLVVFVLAALLLAELIRAGFRANPLAWVKIPPVPTLETNSVPGTNAVAAAKAAKPLPVREAVTNAAKTNIALTAKTNSTAAAVSQGSTNKASAPTNSVAASTNHPAGTDAVPVSVTAKEVPASAPPPMRISGGMPGMPGAAAKLPAPLQARVDKIVSSEMFAPVMRPLPMALLGIAGDTAFLRADNGQTGLVKEGDSLGDVKLLRISINRVLVEQNGRQKELTIFDGYGSDSLLSPKDESAK